MVSLSKSAAWSAIALISLSAFIACEAAPIPSNYDDSKQRAVSNAVSGSAANIKAINPQKRIVRICEQKDRREPVKDAKIAPWKYVCKLIITWPGGRSDPGTGFLVGEKCVITAGHCVFDEGVWAKEITVVPGQNGSSQPFGAQSSTAFWSVEGWTVSRGLDPNYDYGAIILPNDKLYQAVQGKFQYGVVPDPTTLKISGYPDDQEVWIQMLHSGSISKSDRNRYFHRLDTTGGQSGSPLRRYNDDFVIGVHTGGNCPYSDNYGIKCIPDVVRNWDFWCTK